MIKKLVGKWFGFDKEVEGLKKDRVSLIDELTENRRNVADLLDENSKLERENVRARQAHGMSLSLETLTARMSEHFPVVDVSATRSDGLLGSIYDGKKPDIQQKMRADLAVVANNETFVLLCRNMINQWGNFALKTDITKHTSNYYMFKGYMLGVQMLLERVESARKQIELDGKPKVEAEDPMSGGVMSTDEVNQILENNK